MLHKVSTTPVGGIEREFNRVVLPSLGAMTLCLTNPIWVTKTRLVLQYNTDQRQYKGMMDALVKIYTHEGIPGLYRVG